MTAASIEEEKATSGINPLRGVVVKEAKTAVAVELSKSGTIASSASGMELDRMERALIASEHQGEKDPCFAAAKYMRGKGYRVNGDWGASLLRQWACPDLEAILGAEHSTTDLRGSPPGSATRAVLRQLKAESFPR